MFKTKVAPIFLLDEAEVKNFVTGNLIDIYKREEKGLPEFLGYSSINCPPGFQFLLDSQRVILQKVKHCFGYCAATFDILNANLERIMEAAPVSCSCGFHMKTTKDNQLLLYTKRPFVLSGCCDKGMRVEAPKGNLLGYVTISVDCDGCMCDSCVCKCKCNECAKCDCTCPCAKCSGVITKPLFFIMDPQRAVMMTINIEVKVICPYCCANSCCASSCCASSCPIKCIPCACGNCREDVIYTLRAQDAELIGAGTAIGEIRRIYQGCCCPDPPRYEITFPEDLEIRLKVVVMSSVYLMNHLGY